MNCTQIRGPRGFQFLASLPRIGEPRRYSSQEMALARNKYENHVEHPRFGKGPIVSGLNPDPKRDRSLHLHWHTPRDRRIANTAILANRSRQSSGLGVVTHYFDSLRECVDCDRPFIFYAQEQQHWYERLKFNLSANCIRCCECRKSVRDAKSVKFKYDTLISNPSRTAKEHLELAEYALHLFERFGSGKTILQTARRCLNSIPADSKIRRHATFRELSARSKRLLKIDG